ncbi:MAG: hypothetical protein WCV68_02205 [Candidatus Paceibacterota bacterium]|jgi:hypothetical protein
MALDTPILFIIFNRPDPTRRVFNEIRKIKPQSLYIAADGPRIGQAGEAELCEETRRIVSNVDWPCDVHTNFSKTNLGCKVGVSSALNWFFNKVEAGIILEDDCLPNQSFFLFCQELLERYRDTNKIKMISGNNFQGGIKRGEASYYFSHFPHIWGWATWSRAWKDYDVSMRSYPQFKSEGKIRNTFTDQRMQKYYLSLFDRLYRNEIDTWDGQWVYSIYEQNGLSIIPNVNLVSNIGFGPNATHTKVEGILSKIPVGKIEKIIHPTKVEANEEADNLTFNKIYYRSFSQKIITKIKNFF